MLELAKKAFHEVTLFVKFFVVVPLLFAVALGRNDRFGPHFCDGSKNRVSIIGFVAEHILDFVVCQQWFGVRRFLRLSGAE